MVTSKSSHIRRALGIGALMLSSAAAPAAIAADTVETAVAAPEAVPADVESVDAIIAAVYDVISGPAGEKRDWDRFRSLFIDGARLMPRAPNAPGGIVVWSPDDYVERSGPWLEENGFFEREIGRTTETYGDMVHVWSAYDSKRTEADPAPFARGINSFQLMKHEGRWWVVSIFWQSETPDNPIPEDYLD